MQCELSSLSEGEEEEDEEDGGAAAAAARIANGAGAGTSGKGGQGGQSTLLTEQMRPRGRLPPLLVRLSDRWVENGCLGGLVGWVGFSRQPAAARMHACQSP